VAVARLRGRPPDPLQHRRQPPLGSYAFTAALLYPAAAWVGLLVGGSEADIQRELTVTAAGGLAASRVPILHWLAGALIAADRGPGGPHLLPPAVASVAFSAAALALFLRRARTRS
jgi:hypothetical protein